ncbi:Crp/Fnr family transcriptional regulator [Methylocystis sp. IM3]|jgi:CRP-like cAMP-binding protein|uniref:Crp/Fnr family transcriptional regulator n=1 Tax=unclassified Methylocystis TaxID=2625913 RepID=UPI0030F6944F
MPSEFEIGCLKSIDPSIPVLRYPDKTVVYAQGDRLEGLFCLLHGIVKLSHVTEGGMQLTIDVIGKGEVFGTALSDHFSDHTAASLGETQVALVSHQKLKSLACHSPDFATFLFDRLESRQRRTERKMITLLTKGLETRLVEILHELALMFGAPCRHGYALEIPLTQQDIADLVFASRPAVTKAMNALRRRGVLDYRRDLICVAAAAFVTYV